MRDDATQKEPGAADREQVRRWVQDDFALDLLELTEVGHGADEAAELWRGVTAEGAAYAVKASSAGTPAGALVAAHLATIGLTGVAGPLQTRDGRRWSSRGRLRLSVVPWVPGDRALDGGMGPGHWVAYGALLAAVHACDVPSRLADALPCEDHRPDRIVAEARALDVSMRALVEAPDVDGGDGRTDRLVRELAHEWCAAADLVAALIAHTDRLGQELRPRDASVVICHGDPHLGNLLVAGEHDVWLVDWDDAVLAPLERDLMFVLGGVLAFAPVTPEQQSWFFDGYRPVDLDPARLAYHQCTRALEDLAGWAAQVFDARRNAEGERREALSIVRGVLSPTGIVRLAVGSAQVR